jgi:hypothetical protein
LTEAHWSLEVSWPKLETRQCNCEDAHSAAADSDGGRIVLDRQVRDGGPEPE